MKNKSLSIRPFPALFVVLLMLSAVFAATVGPKDSLLKANDKAADLNSLLEKGEYEAAIPVANSTLEYLSTAQDEIIEIAKANYPSGSVGPYETTMQYIATAKLNLKVAISEADRKDRESYITSLKARAAIVRAIDNFPSS